METSNVHYPHLKNGNQHDTNGRVFSGPYNKNGPLDVAAFHHYHTKSYGEYVKKRQRGRSDINHETERMKVYNEAITFFEDALEKNSSGKLGLAETDVVFDDSAWTLLKKVSPGYAVFDDLPPSSSSLTRFSTYIVLFYSFIFPILLMVV